MPLTEISHHDAVVQSVRILEKQGKHALASAMLNMKDYIELDDRANDDGVYPVVSLRRTKPEFPAANALLGDRVLFRDKHPEKGQSCPWVGGEVVELGIQNEMGRPVNIKIQTDEGIEHNVSSFHYDTHPVEKRSLLILPREDELVLFDPDEKLEELTTRHRVITVRSPRSCDSPSYKFVLDDPDKHYPELFLVSRSTDAASLDFSHGDFRNGKWQVCDNSTLIKAEDFEEDVYEVLGDNFDIQW